VTLDITVGKLFLSFELRENSLPTRRLSMRKISEVLRLRFELGLGVEGDVSISAIVVRE
jgi:hypothetical protein